MVASRGAGRGPVPSPPRSVCHPFHRLSARERAGFHSNPSSARSGPSTGRKTDGARTPTGNRAVTRSRTCVGGGLIVKPSKTAPRYCVPQLFVPAFLMGALMSGLLVCGWAGLWFQLLIQLLVCPEWMQRRNAGSHCTTQQRVVKYRAFDKGGGWRSGLGCKRGVRRLS